MISNQLLNFIDLTNLQNWSVKYLLGEHAVYNNDFKLVKIRQLLTRNKTVEIIKDDKIYKRVTIKLNNGGVFLRDKDLGKNIGTKKQFIVSEGQFLLSKIDARNGAFGLVTKELQNAIVTSDFPVFDVMSLIDSNFLVLVTTTTQFVNFIKSCSSGTTNRQRVDIDLFLNQKIPLPPLKLQRVMVQSYNDKLELAKRLDSRASNLEKKIENYLYVKLGIFKPKKESLRKNLLTFVKYQNFNGDWSSQILNNKTLCNKYELIKLKEICDISSGGTPSRSKSEYYNGEIPWVKTGELMEQVVFSTEENITSLGLENSSAKLYPIGSIVIAMYGATIGKTAKLGVEATTNQACAVIYNVKSELIYDDYLWFYLQLRKKDLKSMAFGSAQPNLNAGMIANYEIPLPSLKTQKHIAHRIRNVKAYIQRLKQQAQDYRESAIKDFEAEIFTNDTH